MIGCTKGKYKIIQDPVYGYTRIDPIPTKEELDKFYTEDFYSSRYKCFNDASRQVQEEEKDFFDCRWEFICNWLIKHFGKLEGLSLFDVGFGFAQALLYLHQKGMIVSGLEPSPEGVKYAKSKGLDVYQADISDFSCAGSKKFDVVLLLGILEHIAYPAEALLNIKKKLLKPGGLLVADVPNEFNDFQLIANEEFKLNEWWLCPPCHINYFSASSLKSLIKQCGYDIFGCESSFPIDMFMLFGDKYVGDEKLAKICHEKRVKFELLMKKHGKEEKLLKLYKAFAELDLGRHVVVYAKPKGK